MGSIYSDDEVFSYHRDGSPALYLERREADGLRYLCDYNDSSVVGDDDEIATLVAHWLSQWPEDVDHESERLAIDGREGEVDHG